MDNTTRISANYFTKITPKQEINSEFTLCKCYIQGCGKNRNFTYMSKENILKALPTLNYAPVVGHLFKDKDGNYHIGGHDYEIDEDWNLVALTVPFGVVKADTFTFETVEEYGNNVEYLVGDIILWTGRYPELKEAIYTDDIWFNESMEINVGQYRPLEEDSNYTELLDWEYSALCLLGKSDKPDENVEPCFINSKVQPYKFELSNEFTETFSEMKNAISICFESNGGETEKMTEERIAEIFAELGISKDEIDFEVTTEMTEEEIRNKIDEFKGKESTADEEIEKIVEPEDVDVNVAEFVSDNETIEEPVEETTEETTVEETEEEKIDYCAEYGKIKMEYDALIEELEMLRQFKADFEKAERVKAETEIFSKFDEKLADCEDYKTLKEHSGEYELKALEKECFAIYGMCIAKTQKTDFSVVTAKFSVKEDTQEYKPYGDVFEKYSVK